MAKTMSKKNRNAEKTTGEVLRELALARAEKYLNGEQSADTKVKEICGRHTEALRKHILTVPVEQIDVELLNRMYSAFCADMAAVGGVLVSNDLAEKITSFNAPFGSNKCVSLLFDTHAIRVQLESLEVYLYAMNTNGFYKSLQKTVAEFVGSAECLQKSIDFFGGEND